MSAVINRAKQHHLKAIKWEIGLILLCFICLLCVNFSVGLSFLAGAFSSFLPHCLFVYWVFFKSAKSQQKITAFYWGEGAKWLLTIVLIILTFTLLSELNVLSFFAGYFLALVLNILFPVVLNRQPTDPNFNQKG